MRREEGSAGVWVLIALAASGVAGAVTMFVSNDYSASITTYAVFVVCVGVVSAGLYAEARRDAYAFASTITMVTLVPLVVSAFVVFIAYLSDETNPVAIFVAAVSGIIEIGAFGYMMVVQLARDPLRNILREQARPDAIFEVDGLQFAVTAPEGEMPAGSFSILKVLVQNGWSVERTFAMRLRTETRVSFNTAGLAFAGAPSITLPAGAAGVLSIPIAAAPGASGTYSVVLEPHALGEGGVRLRKWRAQTAPRAVSPTVTLFALLIGKLAFGGGMKAKIRVRKSNVVHHAAPPPPSTEATWMPSSQELHDAKAVA